MFHEDRAVELYGETKARSASLQKATRRERRQKRRKGVVHLRAQPLACSPKSTTEVPATGHGCPVAPVKIEKNPQLIETLSSTKPRSIALKSQEVRKEGQRRVDAERSRIPLPLPSAKTKRSLLRAREPISVLGPAWVGAEVIQLELRARQ